MKRAVVVNYKGKAWTFPVTSELRRRFFSKFKMGKKRECWLWTAATNRRYGILGFQLGPKGPKIPAAAHRVAYQVFLGPVGAAHVLHKCDTEDSPLCVNPAHLYLGDAKEAWLKSVAAGRARDARRLTYEQAQEIRKLYKPFDRDFGARALGRRFGVNRNTVSGIIAGRLYLHPWK